MIAPQENPQFDVDSTSYIPGGISVSSMVVVQGHPELLQIVGALHPPGGFAGRLDRGEQQRDENSDDRNDNQQFHERKTAATATVGLSNRAATLPGKPAVAPDAGRAKRNSL